MATSIVEYSGKLRTSCTHLESGSKIITDAPKDNRGIGSAFSPTDLAATSLASCMMTIIGIQADLLQLNIEHMEAEVTKHMAANPRRIAKIEVQLKIKAPALTEKEKKLIEKVALNCPVACSLHPDILQDVQFEYTA